MASDEKKKRRKRPLRIVGMTGASVAADHPAAADLPEILDSPDVGPILKLHRGLDGFVSFHTNRIGRDSFDLCSVELADLAGAFTLITDEVDVDGFFSINSYFRAGYGVNRHIPQLGRAHRQSADLRYLNACFVDIDCYKEGLTPEQVVFDVLEDEAAGRIPTPSLIVKSGRGVWVLWLLHHTDDKWRPPRAFRRNLDLYRRIQLALVARFAKLGADRGAVDVARVMRVPGSVHSGVDQRVQFLSLRRGAHEPTYTLLQLAARLGVDTREDVRAPERKQAATPAQEETSSRVRRRRARSTLYYQRLRLFRKLQDMRGGFRQGCRNYAAFLYGNFLANRGVPDEEIQTLVLEFGQECYPPLDPKECVKAARQARALRTVSNQTIADWLQITPDESQILWEELGSMLGLKKPWPAAGEGARPTAPRANKGRAESLAIRRDAIRDLVARYGKAPSIRVMVRELNALGIKASRMSVQRDYEQLGVRSTDETDRDGNLGTTRRDRPKVAEGLVDVLGLTPLDEHDADAATRRGGRNPRKSRARKQDTA